MVSMTSPPWYSWDEWDHEKGQLRPDASPEVVEAYRRERERFEREHREAWEQMENPPSPNVEIIPLEDGRVMIRELDEAGNIIRETFGSIEKAR